MSNLYAGIRSTTAAAAVAASTIAQAGDVRSSLRQDCVPLSPHHCVCCWGRNCFHADFRSWTWLGTGGHTPAFATHQTTITQPLTQSYYIAGSIDSDNP